MKDKRARIWAPRLGLGLPDIHDWVHQNRASPFASDWNAADSGIAGNSAVGIKFVPFNRRENRRSLAIFFAEEIAHLGALKIARFCEGAVKIAAATAENRAILVHSDPRPPEQWSGLGLCCLFILLCCVCEAQTLGIKKWRLGRRKGGGKGVCKNSLILSLLAFVCVWSRGSPFREPKICVCLRLHGFAVLICVHPPLKCLQK